MARWRSSHSTFVTASGPREVTLGHSKVVVPWLLSLHVLFGSAPIGFGPVSDSSDPLRCSGSLVIPCTHSDTVLICLEVGSLLWYEVFGGILCHRNNNRSFEQL